MLHGLIWLMVSLGAASVPVSVHGFCIDKPQVIKRFDHVPGQDTLAQVIKKSFAPVAEPLVGRVTVLTDPISLQRAAQDTLTYMEKYAITHAKLFGSPAFASHVASAKKAQETLSYLVQLIEQDKKKGVFRVCDPKFLNKNFSFHRWSGDAGGAKQDGDYFMLDGKKNFTHEVDGKIRLTHYAIYNFSGSYVKTKEHTHALYGLTSEAIPPCSKHEIFAGALEADEYKDVVKPLVWFTKKAVSEAMMQGTIVAHMPDGRQRVFMIHKNNKIRYQKKLKRSGKNQTYWFFQEADAQAAPKYIKKFNYRANVVFAGDIKTIGLGKLIAINYTNTLTGKREIRLGVLADTGGAFTDNLYQLDLFAGIYSSKTALYFHMKQMPNVTEAFILSKK
ncbi:hypothetical protein K2W90_02170 [Candidatus Babeliales bacterium]|nr:hypothetical protein [Candidatus Babeliales bacterium]